VIGTDLAHAQDLAQAYRAALGGTADQLLDTFEPTLRDRDFPGALLAWSRPAGQPPVFYAAAQTQAQWRRLRPLLLAFAGPTLTDFAGVPSRLDRSLAHERLLADAGLAVVARLVPTMHTADSTIRALRRLVTMVARTPPEVEPPPESTGRVLARIRDHLNALAIADARRLLEECRREHRLDALNLKFLEIEILTAARDWRGIVGLSGFDDLLRTRRPPAVTAALLEALYWSAFEERPPDPAGYTVELRGRARGLLRLPAPPSLQNGGWRLYALEAMTAQPQNRAFADAALASGADLGGLAEVLEGLYAPSPRPNPGEVSAAEAAAGAVIAADMTGTLLAVEQARALLARLSAAERAEVLQAEQPRRAVAALDQDFGSAPPPTTWAAWLAAIKESGFTMAVAIAKQGAQEWESGLGDPAEIAQLAECLISASDEPPTSDRLVEGLPHFVTWLQRDPDFPRPAGYAVYEAALDRLLLSGRAAAPMLDSAGALARAMLAIGPSSAAYRRLLADLLEFSGQGAGLRTAYWLIELLEDTVTAPAPDQAARETFWQEVLARLTPIAPQLTHLQRRSLAQLGATLGWGDTLPGGLAAETVTPEDANLAARLAGKLIAVYTLTESAGAQAGDILKALAPDVDVRINSDQGGTRPLRALAENADLFVVVAASATHAATDFIRMRRGERPLVYAAGRGAVSILRAVEDWAMREEQG
jgi:hypothetical protein